MASKAKSTQFRKLEISAAANGPFTEIQGLQNTNFETGSAQFLDATNYASTRKESIAGLDDVQDMQINFQRVVGDPAQNQLCDACFTSPRPTMYFKGTTGQGETMTFDSEAGGWKITGDANTVELGQVTVRPANIVWTIKPATEGAAE